MTKVNYPIQRSTPAASSRQRCWLLITFVAAAGCTWLAVTNGAEQNDSGWAIAAPSPLATGGKTANLHQQMILRRLLDETERPLLSKPSPTSSAQQVTESGQTGLRFAVRSDGPDGWRTVGQSTSPSGENARGLAASEAAMPHIGRPAAAAAQKNLFELDCSGEAVPASEPRRPHPPIATPALADAYGNLPAPTNPITEEEETGRGSLTEALEQDDDEISITESDADDTTAAEDGVNDSTTTIEIVGPTNRPTNTPATCKPHVDSTAKPAPPAPEEVAPPPLTKQLMYLRTRVRSVLSGYYRKDLNSRDNDPWEVMHGMLAYGVHSHIRQGSPRGEAITSVGWLCYNKPCKGQTLMYVNPQGEVRAKYGVGLQGHLGQLLAMLAQCHVSDEYPIRVGNKEFTIRDLIESEKKTCYPKSELTFKLIALQHYIDLNDKWVNDQGVDWDIPRLMREEMAQPIRGAACGGTHRLSGLSLTVKTRLRRGEPLDGEYARADEFIKKYQQYAFRLQNRDGSLSTSWFRGAGDDDDINRRIKTTGHILEWLCYSLSDEELREPRTFRAVTYLANLMYSNYDNDWEIGPRCHATHALLLYDERVFRPFDKEGAVASYRPGSRVATGNHQNSTRH